MPDDRDFREVYLPSLPMNPTDPESVETSIDLYMKLGWCIRPAPDQEHLPSASERRSASLMFVTSGCHFELVAVPFASLKRLVKFITDNLKDYEREIRQVEAESDMP